MEVQRPASNQTSEKPSKTKLTKRFVPKLRSITGRKSKKSKDSTTVTNSESAQPVTSSEPQTAYVPYSQAATWTSNQNYYGGSCYTSMPRNGANKSAQDEYRRRILGFSEDDYREYVPGGRVRRGTYEVEVMN